VQGTFAFVDAKQFDTGSGDICTAIGGALTAYYPGKQGVVIDARGFTSGSPPCAGNPWSSTPLPLSSIVLLPAGTINVNVPWVLPKNTRIIGEGPGLTTLQATSSFPTGDDMIDMGNSTFCSTGDCPAIVVEHLTLNGNNRTGVNGIVNSYSQELGRVDDVAFNQINGIALVIQSKDAANSGPYTKLTMSNVGTCLKISGMGASSPLYDLRGVHGVTCTLSTGATTGVILDAANVSLEDITVTAAAGTVNTQYGIVIGANYPVPDSVLFNIRGIGLKDVIQLSSNPQTPSVTAPNCPPYNSTTTYNVCNTTILGVTNSGSTNTIDDQLNSPITDAYVGMYVLGEPVLQGSSPMGFGNSRITTSPHVPSWLVGPGPASSLDTCTVGSLYSEASGSGSTTLFGCNGHWAGIR
jgi:hypothetical protein